MSIVIKEADGTIRHPFGEFETLEEKAERLEKELEEKNKQIEVHDNAIAELAKLLLG